MKILMMRSALVQWRLTYFGVSNWGALVLPATLPAALPELESKKWTLASPGLGLHVKITYSQDTLANKSKQPNKCKQCDWESVGASNVRMHILGLKRFCFCKHKNWQWLHDRQRHPASKQSSNTWCNPRQQCKKVVTRCYIHSIWFHLQDKSPWNPNSLASHQKKSYAHLNIMTRQGNSNSRF